LVWRAKIPLILTLDNQRVPHRWVTWQQACFTMQRTWSPGRWASGSSFSRRHLQGDGRRSSITARSIIAIKGKAMAMKGFNQVPPLNNASCFAATAISARIAEGIQLPAADARPYPARIPRRHRPWMNVVTACRACNGIKRNRVPEESDWSSFTRLTCRTRRST